MKKKSIWAILCVWLAIGTGLKAQQLLVSPEGLYYIIHQNTIEQYDTTGKLLFQFSQGGPESISNADVSDQMDIILFYKDLQMISVLNQRLALRAESVYLSSYSWFSISAVVGAPSVGYWIYDSWNQKLILLDYHYRAVATTGWLRLLLKQNETPRGIYSTLDRVVLHFPSTGILIFNSSGQLADQIPSAEIGNIYLNNNNLYYTVGNRIWNYNISTKRRSLLPVELPEGASEFGVSNGMLYTWLGDKVSLKEIP